MELGKARAKERTLLLVRSSETTKRCFDGSKGRRRPHKAVFTLPIEGRSYRLLKRCHASLYSSSHPGGASGIGGLVNGNSFRTLLSW